MKPCIFVGLAGLAGLAAAQFPPPLSGVKVVRSRLHENVSISYKEPGICETTPGVKSYSGYVHLPPGLVDNGDGTKQDYPINTFFWFFEARHDPENAPLAIWLSGGPGASSMLGLFQENGPCRVNNDSQTTYRNPWSWNNHVNMLYIDQPNQVGFSYDTPTNVSINRGGDQGFLQPAEPADFSRGVPVANSTFSYGTLSSQNAAHVPNTTTQAAHAIWHFAQTFFVEFPHYKQKDNKMALWTESYGGHWGPAFSRFFEQQNERIENGDITDKSARVLHLDSLGIINGQIDAKVQQEAAISFLYENTYGLKIINQSTYNELMHTFTRPGGCRDQFIACQKKIAAKGDHSIIVDDSTNSFCDFTDSCDSLADDYFQRTDHNAYDIAAPKANRYPPPYYLGYLTQRDVIQAVGSPVNFTWLTSTVNTAFSITSDDPRGGLLKDLAYLLDGGVKVHLVYGDRDFDSNWFGGEMASLAIPHAQQSVFNKTGYAPLLSEGKIGGMTRQHGNLSFSRVFQSGHEVPFFQPEVAYRVFMRAMFDRDIATGLELLSDSLATIGPTDIRGVTNQLYPDPKPQCYVLYPQSCTPEVWEKVKKGTVRVKDFIVVSQEEKNE